MALGDMEGAVPESGTESATEMRQGLFQAILDALPQQLCVLDGRGRVVVVNQAWRAFASAGEALLKPLGEVTDYLGVCERLGTEGGPARELSGQRTAQQCAAGIQARILNQIIDELFQGHPISETHLRELLGHTPIQVVVGAALGILIAWAWMKNVT